MSFGFGARMILESGNGASNRIKFLVIHAQIGRNITTQIAAVTRILWRIGTRGTRKQVRNAINANSGTAIAMPVILVAMQAAANMEHSNASRGRSVSSHRAHQYAAQAAVQSTSGSWVTPLLRWVNIGVAPTKMALANAASLLPVVWRTNIPSPSSARAP